MRRRLQGLAALLATFVVALLLSPAPPAAAAGPRPDFRAPWPCGEGRDYYHHSTEVVNAIDFNIAGSADLGTPALATASGTAQVILDHPGYGNHVRIDHGGGWTTLVGHLSSVSVANGQYVTAGQEVGKVGSTGQSTGPHLHYEQEADGVNQPIVIDGVALRYSSTPARHTSGNCGGGGLKLGGSPTDFSGDGKADVVTFTHGAAADVYAATSTGSGFSGTTVKWNDYFALSGEVPSSGDFDGDGKDDIVTFTRGSLADVYVGLSSGSAFSGGVKWNDFFAVGGEVPATGDFNGDGKDDIVTFTNDANGDAFVALSDGAKFGAGVKWHDFLAPNGEFPAVGDVNGDGKDDVVVFTQGTRGDVFVALSTGSGFAPAQLAHEFFAPGAEQPRVGDVNGDGKDDIVTFTSNADRDVYVALSDGAKFGPGVKWNDSFTPAGEFPYVGDFDGDGKDDIVTFTKNASADVYVGLSTGSSFGAGAKWHDLFGLPGETAF
ncbi:peptidase m23 [Streptomyces albus]|uniref:Peptidase m23 n=1 Tax=Streptomyces albus (strain ATCC 21838 / DSM 41398 / FERM P-419 / JCM 4703 / NBRC 107858) TaxID=1081613 RepID=A0A0B5EGZ5_STRA4|nr:peptidase m23 [Streptomyces albus]AOU75724.1 peptidase m23 [Streptomyces albus]